nr:hypothetical protein GCM10025730_26730 [Promicromonospora thailandica]
MVSAPERTDRSLGPDEVPAAPRPRRGRAIAVLVVLALGAAGVAVTWPRAEPSIVSDKIEPPAPVDPNAAAASCTAEDLDVGLAADRLAVTPGVPVRFTVSVRNESEVQCLVEAPRRSLAVTVYQGRPARRRPNGCGPRPTARTRRRSGCCCSARATSTSPRRDGPTPGPCRAASPGSRGSWRARTRRRSRSRRSRARRATWCG